MKKQKGACKSLNFIGLDSSLQLYETDNHYHLNEGIMIKTYTQINEAEQTHAQPQPEKIKHYLDDYFETFDMATYHVDALVCPYDHAQQGDGKLK